MEFICHVTSRTLLLGMWLLIISHPNVKFDSHRSLRNEFITCCICYMTLCDHVINRLCDFVDKKLALRPATLSSFLAIVLAEVNITFFISHVITWSRVRGLKRLLGWWYFIINFYLSKFGSHSLRGSGDISFFICHMTSCGHVTAGSRNFA